LAIITHRWTQPLAIIVYAEAFRAVRLMVSAVDKPAKTDLL